MKRVLYEIWNFFVLFFFGICIIIGLIILFIFWIINWIYKKISKKEKELIPISRWLDKILSEEEEDPYM